MKNSAGMMCDFAAKNDVKGLRRLIDNDVDPNEADYDKRTAVRPASPPRLPASRHT
jgi:hypothetical protein